MWDFGSRVPPEFGDFLWGRSFESCIASLEHLKVVQLLRFPGAFMLKIAGLCRFLAFCQ